MLISRKTWKAGDSRQNSRVIDAEMVRAFAMLSGDSNPVHLDADYAATTIFKKPIAHGMLVASTISALIAMEIPGPGAIYLAQDLRFLKPVYFGDEITTRVSIETYDEKAGRMTLRTCCSNQRGEDVISGEAKILYRP